MLYRFAQALALLLFLSVACTTNPVTGKKQISFMSKEQEEQIGAQSDPQIVATFGLYDDPEVQEFAERIGQRIVKVSHRPDIGYEFKVLNTPTVNAFAVPGGYVYFTRGILTHFSNEAEFAGVMGHEVGHIAARHSADQYTSQVIAQLGLIVGSAVSETFANLSGLASQGVGLLMLSYSRDHEEQSDKLGVEYSTKIGYDATEMAKFFQTLDRMQQQAGQAIPTFLSTHPDPANREQRVMEMAQEWAQKVDQPLVVNREEYLNLIDGMLYGPDPRQGYVEENMLYLPNKNIQIRVPADWPYQIMNNQIQFAAPDKDAIILIGENEADNPQTAADNFVSQNNFELNSSRNVSISGWNGVEIQAQATDQQTGDVIVLTGLFFDRGDFVYHIVGATLAPQMSKYSGTFNTAQQSAAPIQNAAKKNVEPERLEIVRMGQPMSLQQVFERADLPPDRYDEFSILNNMQLDETVSQGRGIKVLK